MRSFAKMAQDDGKEKCLLEDDGEEESAYSKRQIM